MLGIKGNEKRNEEEEKREWKTRFELKKGTGKIVCIQKDLWYWDENLNDF